ncbi:MAG: DUF523 domain-containing protein [Bacilli bacterium]|nr:DUF523 domain-containing protein [Bacilli bacterium]
MKRVLVSACLLGLKVRFDGLSKENKEILDLINNFEFIPVCPEIMGGLSTPRVPSETRDGKVFNKDGVDVTENYLRGAKETLRLCKIYNCDTVVLKSKSPSCGKGLVYDGTFSGNLVSGNGITTDYLLKNGIKVYSEDEFINKFKNIM